MLINKVIPKIYNKIEHTRPTSYRFAFNYTRKPPKESELQGQAKEYTGFLLSNNTIV
jgi:hypothetical protein